MPRARRAAAAAALTAVLALTACGTASSDIGSQADSSALPGSAEGPGDDGAGSGGSSGGSGPGGTVQGGQRVVLLDPGHNGGNARAASQIKRQVPDGRGGTKACNTTGTSTTDGFSEHEFAWRVARRVGELLEANHVTVKMTRTSDTGVGPCVDARGAMAEQVNADAVVSIHADGGPPTGRGFHVSYSAPPLSQSQGQPSVSLALALRDALRGAGLTPSTYLGHDGIFPRSDLAGLNLSRRPTALVECANMRDPDEVDMISSPAGQARIANAITKALLSWLGDQ